MSRQIEEAYVVAAVRTPVGRIRGALARTRPDDMLAHVIRAALARCPGLDPALVDDVIVGCAMPEAEQGLNVARLGLLLAGLPDSVPGVTVNRFCASGLEAVAMAADRIRLGEADVVIAGGTESMSLIPMMGHRVSMNPAVVDDPHTVGAAYSMGVTAEKVAQRWQVSREDQDIFAAESHRRALQAIQQGAFLEEIEPLAVTSRRPDPNGQLVQIVQRTLDTDEGPRPGTTPQVLAKLKPVFAARGTVTAGNSSQMSDGAGAVVLMSGALASRLNLEPLARFRGYGVTGVAPEVMGIGPKEAVPRLLKRLGLNLADLERIELNEAFAAQALAVIRELGLDPARVNPQGGAIALGHPLGATGAIRTATLVHGLRRDGQKLGMVTMCVGTGMGAAGVFEAL